MHPVVNMGVALMPLLGMEGVVMLRELWREVHDVRILHEIPRMHDITYN